ncbi:MAG: DEAD/DEAH box helicase [Deltaproteobacteria bacterium]|nr:DEAD/DEAH box helicase [Deltaproteobacteria bacterium]
MSGFSRLHPHLQHAIVHDLGWRELRPVQDLTIDAVLDGANAVVLAPTAGGKTEAALFPLLSRILADELRPVAALYVCPIRALLNNQEERVGGYARMVGLSAFKWHGDVAESRRQRFRAEPSHILMTTPESLEVMMISARTDARALLGGVQAVIVDEVHAFAADDRGAHLAALLERISQFAGRDIQRIGLSATVGNPRVIGEWLRGSSQRELQLVDPPRSEVARDVTVDSCADVEAAARGVAQKARGKKSLVFVESRSRAEAVAHALDGSGVEVFIHHSSVSRSEREHAELQFVHGQNTAIVCTATMELGIDVGDLDQVLQVDAPATVASFLQRMGRTGRRPGRRANCSFFCLSPESLMQALAIVRLAGRGWIEDVRPAEHASHILAHQVMALALQEGGVSRHRVLGWIRDAYPFTSIADDELQSLVDTMLGRQILYEADDVLSLGARGESFYGRKHFFELYAVFSSPPMLRVMHGREEVGYVQSSFIQGHDGKQGPLTFRLAGRPWEAVHIDWSKGAVSVNPAPAGRVPSWVGSPSVLSYELCQAMREVLTAEDVGPAVLSAGAEAELRSLREAYGGLLEGGAAPIESVADAIQWHTFAGGAINRLLAAGLESVTGRQWVSGNLSIRSKEAGLVEANEAVAQLRSLSWEPLAFARARAMARGMITKFQPCLPADAEDRLLCDKLLDLPGTLRFLASVRVASARSDAPGGGLRLPDRPVDSVLAVLEAPLGPSRVCFEPRNAVVWVDQEEDLRSMCEAAVGESVIGLDVETALDLATLCLIQIAARDRTWIIDPLAIGDLSPLKPLLASSTVTKVIHNARFERRVLAKHGLWLNAVFDTLEASRERHGVDALGGHSLAAVCERELGVALDKEEQTSNWARRPLSESQMRYAAAGAEVVLRLKAEAFSAS